MRRQDVIDVDDVTIETRKDDKIKPVYCRTPVPVPIHLRKAAEKKLKALLDAGVLD